MRVLAGGPPRGGADMIRMLAAGFEVANINEHLAKLRCPGPADPPYELGTLETAWSRVSWTTTVAEVTEVLGTSSWRLHDLAGRRELRSVSGSPGPTA